MPDQTTSSKTKGFLSQSILNRLDRIRSVFGYSSWRRNQLQIADAIANGRDTLSILGTGSGKTLPLLAGSLARGGIGLIVTPLQSLSKAQRLRITSSLGSRSAQRILGSRTGVLDFAGSCWPDFLDCQRPLYRRSHPRKNVSELGNIVNHCNCYRQSRVFVQTREVGAAVYRETSI